MKTRKLHIVFDGPPSHEAGRFVEVETPDGKGVNYGKWKHRDDGFWVLEIDGRLCFFFFFGVPGGCSSVSWTR